MHILEDPNEQPEQVTDIDHLVPADLYSLSKHEYYSFAVLILVSYKSLILFCKQIFFSLGAL